MIIKLGAENNWIYSETIEELIKRLKSISNKQLLEDYYSILLKLINHKSSGEFETQIILDIRKSYIDEFKIRLSNATISELGEFIRRIQYLMSLGQADDVRAHTVDLVRLQGLADNVARKHGMSDKQRIDKFFKNSVKRENI